MTARRCCDYCDEPAEILVSIGEPEKRFALCIDCYGLRLHHLHPDAGKSENNDLRDPKLSLLDAMKRVMWRSRSDEKVDVPVLKTGEPESS